MRTDVKKLSMAALMLASVFVITRFIQIPIPLGYFNIGNCVILLFCLLLDNPYGIAASGLGSALADLVSYPIYTVPTLVIKALMPWLFIRLNRKLKDKKWGTVIAAAVATLIPLFGYTIVGGVLYGSLVSGIAQFPGLLAEYAANLIIFAVLYQPVMKLRRGA